MKSQAAILREFNAPLAIEELDVPPLRPGEILVKLNAAGVCGSDVHMHSGKDPRTPVPMILGHEGVGTVVEVNGRRDYFHGGAVTAGSPIIWNRGVVCGTCFFCRRGEASLCPSRWAYGIHRSINVHPGLVGCYSQYLILDPATDIFPAPAGIDPAVLVSASCSGATTAHAFDMYTPTAEDTVLIQGPGPIGAFATAFAARAGAARIIVVGGTGERLAVCRSLGATDVLDRHSTTAHERHAAVMEMTDGRGADAVYECVGHSGVMAEGLKLLRRGGRFLTMGFGAPGGSITFDCYSEITVPNVSIHGVWVSDARHLEMAVDLVSAHPEAFSRLVTHRVPLEQADRGIEVMRNREGIKAVLVF